MAARAEARESTQISSTFAIVFPPYRIFSPFKTASINDWGAICYYDGNFHEAIHRPGLEIFDRVGGGDSFASGLAYGFLATGDAEKAVNYGAAHGALAMTTPGDTSMALKEEVEKMMKGVGARVDR